MLAGSERKRIDGIVWQVRFQCDGLHTCLLLDFQFSVDEEKVHNAANLVSAIFRTEYNRHHAEQLEEALITIYEEVHAQLADNEELQWLLRDSADWFLRSMHLAKPEEITNMDVMDIVERPAMLRERLEEWEREIEQRGAQKGMQQGLQEGVKKGMQQGRQESALNTARNLLKLNALSDKQIADTTGLSLAEVRRLKGE